MTKQIYPCLWFDGQAREAADFYCSIFDNSKITTDTPMVVNWEVNGVQFMGLNGGPHFKFNEAVSFVVNCDTQEEIDKYWARLTEGGSESRCGWLKDKYGLSWQIIPSVLGKLMTDPAKRDRVMQVVMRSTKFNIAELENA